MLFLLFRGNFFFQLFFFFFGDGVLIFFVRVNIQPPYISFAKFKFGNSFSFLPVRHSLILMKTPNLCHGKDLNLLSFQQPVLSYLLPLPQLFPDSPPFPTRQLCVH